MKIQDLVKLTNTYLTGEQLVYQKLIPFYDDVIDDINSSLNATFPSFSSLDFESLSSDDAVYDCFPDRYLRSVVALGAAHKFYAMDEEGVAYDTTYEQQYHTNLFYMLRDFVDQVPEVYQSDSPGSVNISIDEAAFSTLPICDCMWR